MRVTTTLLTLVGYLATQAHGQSLGSPCAPTSPYYFPGPSTDCDSGFCGIEYTCENDIPLGNPCDSRSSNYCSRSGVPSGPYQDYPVYCGEGICGGPGASCITDDYLTSSSTTGESSYCASDMCRNGICDTPAGSQIPLGSPCTATYQCANGGRCFEGICGKNGAECTYTGEVVGQSGPSTQCASGHCYQNSVCYDLVPLGGDCSGSYKDCGYNPLSMNIIGCTSGSKICGGPGTSCGPDNRSGTSDGASGDCVSGVCVGGTCPTLNPAGLGETCLDGNPSCESGVNCGDSALSNPPTCGGEGAYCIYSFFSGARADSTCASGICKDNKCLAAQTKTLGETCTSTTQCAGGAYCTSERADTPGTCGAQDALCLAEGGGGSGDSSDCLSGRCRDYRCAATGAGAGQAGDSCDSNTDCTELFTCSPDYLPDPRTCGGPASSCTANEGCTSGTCKNGQCTVSNPSALGGPCATYGSLACSGNIQCGPNEVCGATGASCYAADGSSSGSAPADCTSSFCSNSVCSDNPIDSAQLGEACRANSDCIGDANCGPDGFCGSLGATCYVYNFNLRASTGFDETICQSGFCRNQVCADPTIGSDLGGSCDPYDPLRVCKGLVQCSSDMICGGTAASCQANDDTITGQSNLCVSGLCDRTQCKSASDTSGFLQECSGIGSSACAVGVECSSVTGRCGDTGAFCQTPGGIDGTPQTGPTTGCDSGQCKRSQCLSKTPGGLGSECSYSFDCAGTIECSNWPNPGTCGGEQAYCSTNADCASGDCRNNYCSALIISELGGPCTYDGACSGDTKCSYKTMTCGGPEAQCQNNDGQVLSPNGGCVSNVCKDSRCQAPSPELQGLGGTCTSSSYCSGSISCSSSVCGGGGATCVPESNIGTSPGSNGVDITFGSAPSSCASTFCLDGACSFQPFTQLGGNCASNRDCEGNNLYSPVACAGFRCGSTGAACLADSGAATGASSVCASGVCEVGKCTANSPASPAPPGKRDLQLIVGQKPLRNLCPASETACPVFPKGFECIDTNTNLESCGGCLIALGKKGLAQLGVDCTDLPNVEDVRCEEGKCIIDSCVDGALYYATNSTCILQ